MFVSEPRGSTEELEPVLNGYYNAILGKVPLKKGRGGAKQIVKNRVRKNSSQESAKGGAAFLAVCRGKVLILSIYMYTTINGYVHMHKPQFESLGAACVPAAISLCFVAADFYFRYLKELTSLMTMLGLLYPLFSLLYALKSSVSNSALLSSSMICNSELFNIFSCCTSMLLIPSNFS